MMRGKRGFTILEMMIAMAIVMLVLYAAINFYIVSLRQYKTQTKIIETNLEGVVGLEIMRRDIESMGYGLPWNNLASYTEIAAGPAELTALNESPNAPRAVASIDQAPFTVNQSDYLVVRSARVGRGDAAGKWTRLTQGNVLRTWTPASENLGAGDHVIVLSVGSTDSNRRSLVNPGTFYTTYANTSAYVPTEPFFANIVYGISDPADAVVRPFNRTDYFIDNTSVPQRCAPGTGVLVKAFVEQDASGSRPNLLPLLDCAADMKLAFGLDNNANGTIDPGEWLPAIPAGVTAANLRDLLREVRVFILAQEGQRDDSFTYPATTITMGVDNVVRTIDVSGARNYRWKVYNMAVKPMSLAQ